MSFLEPRSRIDSATAGRIRDWARQRWEVPVDGSVTVTELRCSEPDCPPLETVVIVSPRPGETFQRKVHKPAAELTYVDLEDAHP